MISDKAVHIRQLNRTDEIGISKLEAGFCNVSLICYITEELEQIHSILKDRVLAASFNGQKIVKVLLKDRTCFIRLYIITPMRSIAQGGELYATDSN